MADYNYTPSADRAEYAAAQSGGYAERLAEIFRQAAARAAAAAAEAERNFAPPPWVLSDPSNDTPDVFNVENIPTYQSPDAIEFGGDSVLDDPTGTLGIYYPDPAPTLPPGAAVDAVVMDDYEAAAKAALATGKKAYYKGEDGNYQVVTPRDAYYDGLQVSADRMSDPVEGSTYRPAIAPGSQTEYDAQGNIIPNESMGYPSRLPKDPITGEDLPPMVFMGFDGTEVDGPPGARIESPTAPIFMNSDEVKNFSLLPRSLTDQIINMTNAYYGYMQSPVNIRAWWAQAVDEAAAAYQSAGVLISPLEIYDELIAGAAAADAAARASSGGGYYGGGGGGGGSSVNLTNYTSAKALLNAAMSAWLGRQASDSEVTGFLNLLNEQERANPTTQEVVGDTVIQAGGFDPQQFAEDYVKGMEGSAEYQAVTTYLDAFLAALDGKVGVL